jgi:hypothetical protein
MNDERQAGYIGNAPPGSPYSHDYQQGVRDRLREQQQAADYDRRQREADERHEAKRNAEHIDWLNRQQKTPPWTPPWTPPGQTGGVRAPSKGSGALAMIVSGIVAVLFGVSLVGQMIEDHKAKVEARSSLYTGVAAARATPEGRSILGAPRPWYDPFKLMKKGHTVEGDFFDSLNVKRINDEEAQRLCGIHAGIEHAQQHKAGAWSKLSPGDQFLAGYRFIVIAKANCFARVGVKAI